MIIQHNMAAVNTMMQLGITNTNLGKSVERLSSGYRVNRAADDAAALSISEKKRSQIRGLIRAAKNAEDGVSFVQTGDGAMSQMEGILQRMRELTIQSLNDAVYTPQDRAALQAEFDQLQSELDRINDQTEFNKMTVFEHYPDTYSNFKGNRIWSQDQIHTIDETNQSLTIKYKTEENGPEKEITLTIPKGSYTTQELMDEMDDVVTAMGETADGLYLEYTDDHTCNMVLRNGVEVVDVSGGLSYLFFDQYGGSQFGSLIGTTTIEPGFPLKINQENNVLEFTIEYFDGTTREVKIEVEEGDYTQKGMINYLNEKLAGTGMTAKEHGEYSIMIGGDDGIITGLKGNMFKIDDGESMDSVFYDNTKYGSVSHTSSVFTGGAVLVSNSEDTEYNHFTIDDSNNVLRIRVGTDDTAPYIDIKLDNGEYTMQRMIAELQEKFMVAGLDVSVESYVPQGGGVLSQNGEKNYSFYGIKITANQSVSDIKIDFDKEGSTAYETLFVKRVYTDEGWKTTEAAGKDNYTSPSLTGGMIEGTDNNPAVIDGSNNSFSLHVEETGQDGKKTGGDFTIRLTEGQYNTVDDIIQEINRQIAGGPIGISGKIKAVNAEGAIRFEAADTNQTVTAITFAEKKSDGYKTLFVGEKTIYSTKAKTSSGGSLVLDELDDPVIIDETNDKLTVTVGGEERDVTLPHGQMSPAELAEEITRQLKGTEQTGTNDYAGEGTGETKSTASDHTGTGKTSPGSFECDEKGQGDAKLDGNTKWKNAKPARYVVPVNLSDTTVVSIENNQFKITVKGKTYDIMLTEGAYSPSELAEEFQKKLDDAIGVDSASRIKVSLEGNQLVFETTSKGPDWNMQFGTKTSSFLRSISETKTAASITTKELQSPITIDDNSNQFTMNVGGEDIVVTLDKGNYTPSSFAVMLEKKLRDAGAEVSVVASGNALRFTTDAEGDSASISLDTGNCGSAGEAMFGEQLERTPAIATLTPALPDSTTDVIRNIGEADFTVQLTQGDSTKTIEINIPEREDGYTNEQLLDELNRQLQEQGVSVSASFNKNNSLVFTSEEKGADVSLKVTGNITTTSKTPDIEASVDPEGHLVLRNTSNNAPISVKPSEGSAVLKPIAELQTYNPQTPVKGTIEKAKYTLRTNRNRKIPEPIEILEYNKTFTFTYVTPDGVKNVSIELDEREYSYRELQDVLQQKIDAELGSGELSVFVTTAGITMTIERFGEEYELSDRKGGFYEYVMEGRTVRGSDEKVDMAVSRQIVKDTYIAGRKDIRNKSSKIQTGISDVLSIDVTFAGTLYTLEMTLDPGNYNSDQLIAQIQKKLDEQLEAVGLPKGSILAGIGVYDTGVSGADDKNSLFFYVNEDVELPDGEYRIDALKGSALFEIFYKTEGEITPAYLTGMKDISGGVKVLPGENTFTIDVDGTTYSYTIPEGSYTCKEFLEVLEKVFDNPDAFLTPSLSGNALKISYEKLGEHTIENLQGPAKNVFFYDIDGRMGYDSELVLQIGANENQITKLEKLSMSTMSMGINSITISGFKYANKALQRLDAALNYLNGGRGKYGAKQNRLEYTIKGNENTAENLQASESRDRDADMADEMVQYSKFQILQQSGMAMLTQANQQNQAVLSLLG